MGNFQKKIVANASLAQCLQEENIGLNLSFNSEISFIWKQMS